MQTEPSLDKLLELLNQGSEQEETPVSVKPSVDDFIKDYGIESGEKLYPNYIIFYLYKQKWEGRERHGKEKKIPFFRNFSKRFESFRKKRQRYYKLNNFIEITEKLEYEASQYDQIYEKQKKTKSKKKS